MLVTDLQGKTHKLNLGLYNKQRANCSAPHKAARELLNQLFPCVMILEEVPLPGTRMVVDFFLPSKNLMVEVNGQQHYQFNNFHYKNKMDFYKAKKRDNLKGEWAAVNGLTLITLPDNEDINEWTKRISTRND